ncbi:HK97 gp10 family phage protein [Sphingomonas sp. A2-49]|uniref:HK97 gp10 family phage protein n=1 Tax=Sphingomonas sp. A2-49 TaxID=1391375 RepID=UPI0021D20894|nr:HK97 gp10 family phage protein [Sphingomonas sp. A2-49]MCU6454349.1 HK97 gp10 family phage protein [Sphingomonas sp. A2-49]
MAGGVRGRAEVSRYLAALPEQLTKVLRGAGRAGGAVIADEARAGSRSDYVSRNVTARTRVDGDQVRVTVSVKPGFARSIATWLEYGTAAHFISVDDSLRQGMTARRINRAGSEDLKRSLVINGKGVGRTVHHPGADKFPFLRPALDKRHADAIATSQAYITARIKGGAVVPDAADTEDDE